MLFFWMLIVVMVFVIWDGVIVFLIFVVVIWLILFLMVVGFCWVDLVWFKVVCNLGVWLWYMFFVIILLVIL